MVTTDVELQLTQQLKEAGKQLSLPPTSDDEFLHVLDVSPHFSTFFEFVRANDLFISSLSRGYVGQLKCN